MGWSHQRQAKGRAKLEAKVAPALAAILGEGEHVRAAGLAQVMAKWPFFLIGAGAALMMRMYWVVATDRQLALIRLPTLGGDVSIEKVVPIGEARVVRDREGAMARLVTIDMAKKRYRFRFVISYRSDGAAIATAIRSGPEPPVPSRPD